jgi:hypothetical protein
MIKLHVYVLMSHTRMVLSREPVIILVLRVVSAYIECNVGISKIIYSSNWTQ